MRRRGRSPCASRSGCGLPETSTTSGSCCAICASPRAGARGRSDVRAVPRKPKTPFGRRPSGEGQWQQPVTDSADSPDPPTDDLDRLADAVEAYIERRSGPSSEGPLDDYLARHESVRDLLEPMLDQRPGEWNDERTRRLGDYVLGRELGRGGMGVVYEAVEESLGRRVALKVLSPHLPLSARQVERFRREAAAAAKLAHPDIVRIHAVGEHDGTHFIAMQLVEGRNLRAVLDEVRAHVRGDASRLSARGVGVSPTATGGGYFDQVAELAARIAAALAYSHERGVVHRDIKPQNILVTAAGELCIVDFGLAKDLEAESLSITGDFAGTPQYVSPEQVEAGRLPIDGRSDVFSLGVVLYELLTLAMPFTGSTTRQVMAAIAGSEAPLPRSRSPNVPRDLETIVLKALEKDPRRRYEAAGMAADLRRFLAREPITARPISAGARLLRLLRRKPAASLAAVLAFLLLVVTPVAAMIHFRNARDEIAAERHRALEQRDLARRFLLQARSSVQQLFTRLAEFELEALPHTEALRLQLLQDARDFSDELQATAGDDPVLCQEAARARGALARLQYSLSQAEPALASLDEAIELIVKPRCDGPLPLTARIDLAAAHQLRAQALIDLLRHDEAELSIAAAQDLLRPLLADDPDGGADRTHVRQLQASLLDARRRCSMRYSATAESLALNEQANAIWSELVAENPDDAYAARMLAEGTFSLASIHIARGRLATAREHFEQAVTLFRRLLEQRPQFPPSRFRLASTLLGLSDARRRLGDAGGGAPERDEALRLLEQLRTEYPETPRYRRTLLGLKLIETLQMAARNKTVAEADRIAPELLREAELLADLPDARHEDRFHLAKAHAVLAQIEYMRSARDVDALEGHHAQAISILRELRAAHPSVERYACELGGALSNRANWLLTGSGRPPDTAVPLLEEAIALQAGVLDQVPTYVTAQRFLWVHWNLLAEAGRRAGDPALLGRAAIGKVDLAPTSDKELLQAVGFVTTALELPTVAANDRDELAALACGWLQRALPENTDEARLLLQQAWLQPLANHPDFIALRDRIGR
ncbi:MAG: serine/threonine protein kinase [Planctomycetes bacterium]|nr:serine/threonine protein kinase [Planctomycetota bacterium]